MVLRPCAWWMVLLLLGCATAAPVKREVPLYTPEESPDGAVNVFGQVEVSTPVTLSGMPQRTDSELMADLRQQATAAGADAVYDVTITTERQGTRELKLLSGTVYRPRIVRVARGSLVKSEK